MRIQCRIIRIMQSYNNACTNRVGLAGYYYYLWQLTKMLKEAITYVVAGGHVPNPAHTNAVPCPAGTYATGEYTPRVRREHV